MVSFRILRQIETVIRFWIAVSIWVKRKKLCFVAHLSQKGRIGLSFFKFTDSKIEVSIHMVPVDNILQIFHSLKLFKCFHIQPITIN